jgi:hypothetical protein
LQSRARLRDACAHNSLTLAPEDTSRLDIGSGQLLLLQLLQLRLRRRTPAALQPSTGSMTHIPPEGISG